MLGDMNKKNRFISNKNNNFYKGESQMRTNQDKIIKPRLGLLALAKELGNVSQACKVMG